MLPEIQRANLRVLGVGFSYVKSVTDVLEAYKALKIHSFRYWLGLCLLFDVAIFQGNHLMRHQVLDVDEDSTIISVLPLREARHRNPEPKSAQYVLWLFVCFSLLISYLLFSR